MALDTDTPADRAPRKTLDEIRRELDVEYGTPAVTEAPAEAEVAEPLAGPVAPRSSAGADEAAIDRFDEPAAERQRSTRRRRSGYLIAGLIGCIAGQVALLGVLAVLHDRTTSDARSVSKPVLPVGATLPVPTSPESGVPRVPVSPPAPYAAVSGKAATPLVPPMPIPAPVADDRKPGPRRIVSQPPAVPAPRLGTSAPRSEPQARVMDYEDWARSQEEVRAALRRWLAMSGHADGSVASGTVVFLGADGRTARTHVPTRSASGIIIREQRWERQANDWRIVEDREAWRAK